MDPGCLSYLIKNIYFKCDEKGDPIWSDTYEYGILASEIEYNEKTI